MRGEEIWVPPGIKDGNWVKGTLCKAKEAPCCTKCSMWPEYKPRVERNTEGHRLGSGRGGP